MFTDLEGFMLYVGEPEGIPVCEPEGIPWVNCDSKHAVRGERWGVSHRQDSIPNPRDPRLGKKR